MIHFRSRSYDCMMYDQLLWEPADRVVAVVATDYVNVGFKLALLSPEYRTGNAADRTIVMLYMTVFESGS